MTLDVQLPCNRRYATAGDDVHFHAVEEGAALVNNSAWQYMMSNGPAGISVAYEWSLDGKGSQHLLGTKLLLITWFLGACFPAVLAQVLLCNYFIHRL
jgi:hypothetical protein